MTDLALERDSIYLNLSPADATIELVTSTQEISLSLNASASACSGVSIYATEVELLAADLSDGKIAYAQDTYTHWLRQNGTWVEVTAGDITGAESLGTGSEVFAQESSGLLQFKTLLAGTNVTLDETSTDITINADGQADTDVTQEALSFNIDYATGTTPTTGTVVTTQAEATALGTIKCILDAIEVLPKVVAHNITLVLASGSHRPRNPEPDSATAAFPIINKSGRCFMPGVTLALTGSTTYTAITGSRGSTQTISSFQAGSQNPYIVVSGTPWGTNDLTALKAVTSTGQILTILKNSSNTLYVCEAITGTPTTVFVGRPSTTLKNSLDDVTGFKSSSTLMLDASTLIFTCSNVDFQGFNKTFNACSVTNIKQATFTNCTSDIANQKDLYGFTPGSLRGWNIAKGVANRVSCVGCTHRVESYAASPVTGSDEPVFLTGTGTFASFSNCVFTTMTKQLVIEYGQVNWINSHVVGPYGVKVSQYAQVLSFDNGSGRRVSTFRGQSSTASIEASDGGRWLTTSDVLKFEALTLPGIQVKNGGSFDSTDNTTIANGDDANSDVGVEISTTGVNAFAQLGSSFTLSGTAGELKFAGVVGTYAALVTAGGYIDGLGNTVRKAS